MLFGLDTAYRAFGLDVALNYSLYQERAYRMNLLSAAWALLLVLFSLSLCYFLSEALGDGPVRALAKYAGRNLTAVYVIQWLLISAWEAAEAVVGWSDLSDSGYLLAGLGIAVLSLLLSIPLDKRRKKKTA